MMRDIPSDTAIPTAKGLIEPMELPELIKQSAKKLLSEYCETRVSCRARNQTRLTYNVGGNRATLMEERCCRLEQGNGSIRPVAQFRYHQTLLQWSLHYYNSGRKIWVFYLNCNPTLNLAKILKHVDDDPLGMFWI